MKNIIENLLCILGIASILGIFIGLIMCIWISGDVGLKVFLTCSLTVILIGAVTSAIDDGLK